ncbi:MAG: hypothetical protein ABGF52_13345 [Candidatus Asgardarchaeum sp.]
MGVKKILFLFVVFIVLSNICGRCEMKKLDSIRLTNPGIEQIFQVESVYTGEIGIHSLCYDGQYIYAGTRGYPTPGLPGAMGQIVKIEPNSMTKVAVLTLNEGETEVQSLITDGTYLYAAYTGGYTNLLKIDPATLLVVDRWELEKSYGTRGIAFDGTYIYIASLSPVKVLKIDPKDMSRVSTCTLAEDEKEIYDLLYDGTYLYAACFTWPGKIVKIDPSTMTKVSTLTLNTGEDCLTALCYDGTYIYGSCYTTPGKVVKIDVASFSEVSSVTLEDDERQLRDIVFDGEYIYVSCWWKYGKLVKIDPYTMTRISALYPDYPNYKSLSRLTTDGEYIYASYAGTEGQVYKIISVGPETKDMVNLENVSIGAGEIYKFFSYKGEGILQEALISSPNSNFGVLLNVDGIEILNKSYTELEQISSLLSSITALPERDENGDLTGNYIICLKNISFQNSVVISVKNNSGSPVTFNNLFTLIKKGG